MTATPQNLDLWKQAFHTDPAYTKGFTRGGGFRGTALNGTYIVQRLTELFGPCGQGWRLVLEEERIVVGPPLNEAGTLSQLHVVRAHLDYRSKDGWFSTGPQFGQTMLVGKDKNGVFFDEEAPKKSMTDALSKCAVLVGVGADIHLGLYDDNKYVNEMRVLFAPEPGGKKPVGGQTETISLSEVRELEGLLEQALPVKTEAEAAKAAILAHLGVADWGDIPAARLKAVKNSIIKKMQPAVAGGVQ